MQPVVGKVERLQLREAGQGGCSMDGSDKATSGEPQGRDAATCAVVAAHTFPAAAGGAEPRGTKKDGSATEVACKAPQRMEVIRVA